MNEEFINILISQRHITVSRVVLFETTQFLVSWQYFFSSSDRSQIVILFQFSVLFATTTIPTFLLMFLPCRYQYHEKRFAFSL